MSDFETGTLSRAQHLHVRVVSQLMDAFLGQPPEARRMVAGVTMEARGSGRRLYLKSMKALRLRHYILGNVFPKKRPSDLLLTLSSLSSDTPRTFSMAVTTLL